MEFLVGIEANVSSIYVPFEDAEPVCLDAPDILEDVFPIEVSVEKIGFVIIDPNEPRF